ncbi:CrcB family protein [Parvularcula marina]|uniref:Fluoride-specific ion channel FluC n=2 Tax=Parvularcula marina TaxID=2292771 RepID=A0A371R7T0_9PROT|nr:CrcB family protein [Parvularcula marina]
MAAAMNMASLLAVGAGGAIGAMARYAVHRGLSAWHGAEAAWSTLGVNVAGSLALGLAAGLLSNKDSAVALFIMMGICGAFTTFSTFALDIVVLFRDRGIGIAALYMALSVSLSVMAFLLGLLMSRGSLS